MTGAYFYYINFIINMYIANAYLKKNTNLQ